MCPKCGQGDLPGKAPNDIMVGCEECLRWWHVKCSGDAGMLDYIDDLSAYPFTCIFCGRLKKVNTNGLIDYTKRLENNNKHGLKKAKNG